MKINFLKGAKLSGNSFSDLIRNMIMPQIVSEFRDQFVLTNMVYTDFNSTTVEKGDVISIPLPVVFGEADDFVAGVGVTTDDINATSAKITIDQHKAKQFKLSDTDLVKISKELILPSAVSGAVKSVVASIEKKIGQDLATQVGSFCSDTVDATKVLTVNDAVRAESALSYRSDNFAGDKNLILTYNRHLEVKDSLIAKSLDVNAGSVAFRQALMGDLVGLNTFRSKVLSDIKHVSGTAKDHILSLTSDYDPMDTVMSLTASLTDLTGSTFKKGDILRFADADGKIHQILVTSDFTCVANAATVQVRPLNVFVASGETVGYVELSGTYDINVAMYPEAYGLAVRSSAVVEEVAEFTNTGANIVNYTDALSGLTIKLEAFRNSQTGENLWRFEVLAGGAVIYPQLATLVLPEKVA